MVHDPSSVAIVFTTQYPKWYRGVVRSIKHTQKIRGDLARQTIKEAVKRKYHAVVLDGHSAKTFYRELKQLPVVVIARRHEKKPSAVKREGIRKAAKTEGIKAIVLSEPEKVSLITDCIDDIVKPILENEADIVVPKRNEKLYKETYPAYMYESEKEGNSFYSEALRVNGLLSYSQEDLDMFFGPRAFRNESRIVALFMRKFQINAAHLSFPEEYFDAEQYSNVLFFPIILALKRKLRVRSITVPFTYPHLQKRNEEKGERELFSEKRRSQRLGLLVELLHFISFLEKNKSSKMKVMGKK